MVTVAGKQAQAGGSEGKKKKGGKQIGSRRSSEACRCLLNEEGMQRWPQSGL